MSEGFTIRSNARRAARRLGADPEAVVQGEDKLWRVMVPPPPFDVGDDVTIKLATGTVELMPPVAEDAVIVDESNVDDQLDTTRPLPFATAEDVVIDLVTGTVEIERRAKLAAPIVDKHAALRAMLERAEGATVAEIGAAFGWQPHTARGRVSDINRKAGRTIVTTETTNQRGRVYRIQSRAAGEPA